MITSTPTCFDDELDAISLWNKEHPDSTDEEEEAMLFQRGWCAINLTGDRSAEYIASELKRALDKTP